MDTKVNEPQKINEVPLKMCWNWRLNWRDIEPPDQILSSDNLAFHSK